MVILSFRCKQTKKLFEGKAVPRFANFRSSAERKLQLLDSAATLDFLRSPPGNHLEALSGERQGEHSIRVNAQFRICFVWTVNGPQDVEIIDYH
jgi:toxin HigB-1